MKRTLKTFPIILLLCLMTLAGCKKYTLIITPPPGDNALKVTEETSKIHVLAIIPFNSPADTGKHNVASKFSLAVEKEFLRYHYYDILPQKKMFQLPKNMEWQISESDAAKIGRTIKADAILWGSILSYKQNYEERVDHYSKRFFDVLVINIQVELKFIKSSDGKLLWRKVYNLKTENRQPTDWMLFSYSMLNDLAHEFSDVVTTDLMPIAKQK